MENTQLGGEIPVSNLPFGNESLALAIKNYGKADIKVFYSCPILLYFFTLFQTNIQLKFVEPYSTKKMFK